MINQRGYKFYVVVDNKIESGWEYKEDAQDQKKELRDPKAGRVLTKSSLRARGIDPDNDASWMTGVGERRNMNASRKRKTAIQKAIQRTGSFKFSDWREDVISELKRKFESNEAIRAFERYEEEMRARFRNGEKPTEAAANVASWWGSETLRESGRERARSGPPRLDSFTQAYFEAALWSTNDESDEQGGEPLDANYSISDFEAATRDRMIADCADFQERYGELISSEPENHRIAEYGADGLAGHDFWLTRNGHGAGFWDGGWPVNGERLSEAAKSYGEVWLTVNDDGQIDGHESSRRHSSGFSERRGVVRASGRQVADFSSIDALIRHAGQEGATHYSSSHGHTKVWFPLGGGRYDEADAWNEGGYWHLQGPSDRTVVGRPPPLANRIPGSGGRRKVAAGGVVKDYIAVDHRDRIVGGPSKDKEAMRRAAGGGGVVKFVPSSRRTAERMYNIVAINQRTGKKTYQNSSPLTHREAVTMKNKFTPHRDVRIQLEPVEAGRHPKARRSARRGAR